MVSRSNNGNNDNKVLHDIVTNLDVFGPKKNIVDV